MDLQQFLSLERKQLQKDRERLSTACPAALLMQNSDYMPMQCQRRAKESNELLSESSSLATGNQNLSEELHLDLSHLGGPDGESEGSASPTKSTKEFANQRQLLVGSARQYKSPDVASRRNLESGRPLSENRLPIRRTDDMEQWVTDTFYSYFPGFNNENQKRQTYLRERQRENQQNFLKHQMLHPPVTKHQRPGQVRKPSQAPPVAAPAGASITARSSQSSTSTSNHSTTDKTDLELIVNSNPNYVPPKVRSTTTRNKLLQDLGHVELSNIVTGDGIMERNLRSAELETARKKDYQRDLMLQIEEKRRSIELLREKERRQEEALTRRLENQLKTIQLEEQLEKERLRVEKARNDTEHNRLMREQLLAKLEQDAQLLLVKESNNNLADTPRSHRSKKNIHNSTNNISSEATANKVYKYFSNSAHHEYRRGQPLPPAVELDFELPQMAKIERECFHLCEKICPLCDEPLKSYESCCLRCQRKLAVKLKQTEDSKEKQPKEHNGNENGIEGDEDPDDPQHNCQSSYALVCHKCERLYAMCSQCLAKSDVCRACQRERNVCMNCRRNLCSFCLEEVACGRNTERTHVNETTDVTDREPHLDNAFRVLELNYEVPAVKESTASNLMQSDASPPYSINIARNSVFHSEYKPTPVKPSFVEELPTFSGSANVSLEVDSADEQAMERVRRQTDQRLSRYLQNYGDLASKQQKKLRKQDQLQLHRSKSESRHRGTQTTPQSLARRDVVLREAPGHNLSMPLLREMPKMTRKETAVTLPGNGQHNIDSLKKRWEVPAVQKFTVSNSSPKILTQVGAIRKQLQAARFFDDVVDEPDDY
ncbi:uncharacterized protein LOC117588059 [Drosophila guanche]|uniref:Uncharacterized protein n=2 Tax=Drosophila guanche TaxID=7266 RepID=A0A3B0KL48_DROGU|nr:uncharacterized protein LOC117588059 [Drosophila guanche]SPP85811.1 Hypothetical predicted protein [Drosophila guanche]